MHFIITNYVQANRPILCLQPLTYKFDTLFHIVGSENFPVSSLDTLS